MNLTKCIIYFYFISFDNIAIKIRITLIIENVSIIMYKIQNVGRILTLYSVGITIPIIKRRRWKFQVISFKPLLILNAVISFKTLLLILKSYILNTKKRLNKMFVKKLNYSNCHLEF